MEDDKKILIRNFYPAVFFLLVIWLVFSLDIFFNLSLWKYGLFPLKPEGLIGIVTMPLIHSDIYHLINNSIPLIILFSFLYSFYKPYFLKVIILIWLSSGFWTWFFARSSYHIGASGLIYGLATFIFFAGIIIKQKRHIAISLIIVFLYGSMVWGIFPIEHTVSWEGHLSGFLAGIVIAYFYKKELKETYIIEEDEEEEDDDNDFFFEEE